MLTGRSNSQAKFENNIFINATDAPKTETWNRGNQHGGQTYDNNMYVNYANKPASDSNAVEVADVKTVLANAGHAPSAPKATGSVYGRSGSEFDGYKPVDGSPAINAGKVISDMNDYAVTNDFFGNTIKGTPDLGAVESNVLSVSGKVNAYETATVGGSKVVYVPFTAKNPTTVKQLRAGLTVGDGSVANVYRGSNKLTADAAIQADDVLRFEVEGTSNTPIEYTIAQKNAWNWVDDFKTDSQGPIWTSQRQVSGEWQTITDFGSDVYPQTYYDKYYGVGVDYQNKSLPADRSAIHGLIADNPGDSAATAMAWTAPKAGSVKVTLDEVTGANVEPYIRQSGSNGKDVVLKLLKNDEVICSATMTDSFATATGFNECLASAKGTVKVAVGDVLRFSVDAAAGTSKSSIHISPVITYTDADEPEPEPGLSEQYAAAYPASVAAKVGEKAAAAVSFTKGGAAADAPAGTTFAVAGDGFTVAADGTVSFTPTDAQAGKTVTATVTVTYSDKSTDTATVTFKVAAKTEPEPKPEPTDPKADLRKEVESASKFDEKDYTADSWKVFAAALDNAKAVLEDKDATEAQISGALTTLKSATAALAKAGDTGKPDDGDKPSAGKPNDKGNGLSKTGASVAVIGVAMLLLAAAGFVTVNVVRRRR